MELEIYDRQGALKRKVSPDSSSRWTEEVGAEFVVTVNFTTWEFFVLSVGDYVEISGKRFSIKKEYRPKKTDTQKYTYNISFYGREHDMQDLLFCRLNQGEDDLESVFAYDGTPMEMLEKLVANMNRNTDGVTWRAGQAVTGDRKTINFNGLFCWDAAGEIAGAWETEWWLDGEYLNIGKCEHGERVTLGYMKGLKTGLTQNENSNSIKWFTRLIPVGSTKNIDPSKYGYTHLQLPSRDKYIDLNTQLGLKEHREEAAFQDIFPHRLGTVSSVRSEEQTNTDGEEYTVYYIKDKDLPFNPDEYMIGEEVIHITFESGDLSGREFECNWHNGTQEFEIINTYPDENTQIPGGNIIPQAGDTYILTNIRMPDEYYPIAEEQYKQAVDSFLTEYSKDISIYSGDTDYIHVDKNSVPLSLGQRVRLEDAQYFENGYIDTRITRIERKLGNLSEASIDCSSAVSTSWKSSVDSTLNNLEYTLAQEMAQANVRLLKTGDMESPSDYTAFSSLRAIGTFLRKNIADIANEIITFLKGLRVGKFVTGLVGGSGAAIWFDKNGKTIVEADKAMFREELIVPRITFNCIDVISGDKANSFAYGRMKTVDTENRTATLELLEGQWGTLHVSDICRGILHNIAGSNHTKDEYGPNGFMEYSGYATSYFTPTRIIENEAGNMKFEYALQAGTSVHPLPGMNFFAYGNFTDKDRQAITYENRYYTRRLINVNTWVIDPDVNIAYQSGDLSGLTINGQIMDGYSSYQKNVYVSGTIERLKPSGEVAMDLSYEGVWQSGVHYDYYDSVTHNGSTWACLNNNGSSSEPGTDADWQEIASQGPKGDKGDPGDTGPQGVPGPAGADGKTLYTWIRYADDADGGGISNDPTGKAYIGFAYNKETSTESNTPSDYIWSEIKGEQGVPGAVGADGKTYYTWIAYSDNADGSGMYQQPKDTTKYIGIAVNKETATESSNPADYTWSLFKGADGVSVTNSGPWYSGLVVPKMSIVTMGGSSFLSKVATTNPPLWCWTDNAGNRFTFNDGGYCLTGEINTDEYELLVQSGKDGRDAKDHEFIFTNTTTNTRPSTPETSQTDDYVPSGWNDDPVGVSASIPYEWVSKRTKKDGIWGAFSTPEPWANHSFNAISADLDNQMDNAALDENGKTVDEVSITTTASMWNGATKLSLSSISVQSVTGVTSSYDLSTGDITLSVAKGTALADRTEISITVKAMADGVEQSRVLKFTLAGVRGGKNAVLYSLVTSASNIVKKKDGTYSVSGISATRMKTVGGVSEVTTDGTLIYAIDNGSEISTSNGASIPSSSISSKIIFSFYDAKGVLVDIESVPMIQDGVDGQGYTQMGQFKTGMVVPKMGVVSMGGGSYVAKVATTNPPLWCWTDNAGNRFTFNDGGYVLTGEVNTAEYDVWAEKGDTGEKGDKGDDGEKGDKGDKGDQGVQGIQGCIIRDSEWTTGVTYRNDEALTSGTRYIDIVMVRNNSAVDGWDVYKCIKTHTSSSSITYTNTTYWTELSNVGPIYTSLIIAKNASLDFVQGNELIIKDSNNNVVAGLTGGSSKEAGTTPVRIWAGGGVPGSAPFRVDQEGNLVASKANITGTISATGGTIGPFSISSSKLSSRTLYESETNKYVGFNLSAQEIEFYNERTNANVKIGGNTKYTLEGLSLDAGINIQSPNALIGMHIKTLSIPLMVEGGNIYLHPDADSNTSVHGLVLNARVVNTSVTLNDNDDIISFTNSSNITVKMPNHIYYGKVLFMKKYSGNKVTLTGGTFVNSNSAAEISTLELGRESMMFIGDARGNWIIYFCG